MQRFFRIVSSVVLAATVSSIIRPASALADYDDFADARMGCTDAGNTLKRDDYLDLDDGQLSDSSDLDTTFSKWSQSTDASLTIAIYFHGGLVSERCALQDDSPLKSEFSSASSEPTIAPYFVIYHVGPTESFVKGNQQAGLFKLEDNQYHGILNRWPMVHRLDAQRRAAGRDHADMTALEDQYRLGFPLPSAVGRAGQLMWAYMKQVVVDGLDLTHPDEIAREPLGESCTPPSPNPTFTPQEMDPWPHIRRGTYDPAHAGTRDFLCRLEKLIDARAALHQRTKIVLIGHSTGAIYISQLIREAKRVWSPATVAEQKFSVIYLAPAVSYDDFYKMIIEAGDLVRNIRIFTMKDSAEKSDLLIGDELPDKGSALARYYQGSLLYVISGLLESWADKPIIGMDRFLDAKFVGATNAYDASEIAYVTWWFERFGGSSVVFNLSPTAIGTPIPFATCEVAHGDFGTDRTTNMQSVTALIDDVSKGIPWPEAPTLDSSLPPCKSTAARKTPSASH